MSTNKNNTLPGNPNTSVDEMLHETQLGDFLSRNKNVAIALVVLIIVGVFGWGIYNSVTLKNNDEVSSKIYAFETTSLKELADKKLKPADFMVKYKALSLDFGNFSGAVSIILSSSEELKKQGEAAFALEVLKTGENLSEKYASYIISLHLAAAYEDAKDYTNAINILEKLSGSKFEVNKAKVYLDLGRLYLLTGDKSKAKLNFQYIIDNLQDKEMIKLAKLYLNNFS